MKEPQIRSELILKESSPSCISTVPFLTFYVSGLLYSFLIILDGLKIPPATVKTKTLDTEISDVAQYNSTSTKDNKMNDKMRNNNHNEYINEDKSTDSSTIIRHVAEKRSTNPFATDGDGDGDGDMIPDKNLQQDDRIVRDEKKRKKNNGYMPLTFPSQESSHEISSAYDAGRGIFFASQKSSNAVSSNPFDTSYDDSEKDLEKEVEVEKELEVGVEAEVNIGVECMIGGESDKMADQKDLITRTSITVPVKDNCEMENKNEKESDMKAVGQLENDNGHQQIAGSRTITTTPPPSQHFQIPHTDPQSCVPVGLRNSQPQIQDLISEQKPYTTTAIKIRNPLVEKILTRHHPCSPQYYEFIGPKFFFFFISCSCVTLFWVLQFPQLFHFSSRGRGIEYDEKCVKMLSLIFGMLIAICTGTWLSLIVKVSK